MQRDDVRASFAGGTDAQARQGAGFVEDGRNDLRGIGRVREIVLEQRVHDVRPAGRVALVQRGAPGPLVEFRRGEQLIDGGLQRERRALCVPARHDDRPGCRAGRTCIPAEVTARAFDAAAPAGQQRVVDRRRRPFRAPRRCRRRTGSRPADDASRRGAGWVRRSVFGLRGNPHAALVANQARHQLVRASRAAAAACRPGSIGSRQEGPAGWAPCGQRRRRRAAGRPLAWARWRPVRVRRP